MSGRSIRTIKHTSTSIACCIYISTQRRFRLKSLWKHFKLLVEHAGSHAHFVQQVIMFSILKMDPVCYLGNIEWLLIMLTK